MSGESAGSVANGHFVGKANVSSGDAGVVAGAVGEPTLGDGPTDDGAPVAAGCWQPATASAPQASRARTNPARPCARARPPSNEAMELRV